MFVASVAIRHKVAGRCIVWALMQWCEAAECRGQGQAHHHRLHPMWFHNDNPICRWIGSITGSPYLFSHDDDVLLFELCDVKPGDNLFLILCKYFPMEPWRRSLWRCCTALWRVRTNPTLWIPNCTSHRPRSLSCRSTRSPHSLTGKRYLLKNQAVKSSQYRLHIWRQINATTNLVLCVPSALIRDNLLFPFRFFLVQVWRK